jgi:hypothetical protein
MGTATLVKRNLPGATGVAHLYRLDPPVADTAWGGNPNDTFEFVRVSATVVPGSGPETYIFPADETGAVIDWGELPGSYRGGLDHAEALRGAGYEVA